MQAIIANNSSVLAGATLAASSVRPSSVFERLSVVREGNGEILLAGAYTGEDETTVEVEILNGGGVPAATAPVFAGVGSGQLVVTDVDAGAAVQSIVLTLADLGVTTATAQLDLGAVVLRARAAGEPGNQVRISVLPALARAATSWSLLREWAAGTATQSGEQWDFGALPLTAAGELAPGTPRIAFGNDPAVYRPWKQFRDGAWVFGLSPALERSVPAGARVWSVSGGYEVTVSDGVATEVYPAVTLHDLLTQLVGSALVEVAGVVAADRRPGGASVVDVPIRTSAWVAQSSGVAVIDYVPVAAAPTETVVFTCTESRPGADRWSVAGAVSGTLPPAMTGVPYAAGPVASAVIPARGGADAVLGETSWSFSPTGRGDEDPAVPSVCLNPVRLGAAATAGLSVTFTYTKRPDASCSCAGKTVGAISDFLLGLTGGDMSDLDPALQSRATALFAWRRAFVETHCGLGQRWRVRMRESGDTALRLHIDIEGSEADASDYADAFIGKSVDAESGYIAWDQPTLPSLPAPPGPKSFGNQVWVEGVRFAGGGPIDAVEIFPAPARWSVTDTAWLDAVVALLAECLQQVYSDATALDAWDACFSDAQTQAAALASSGDDLSQEELVDQLYQRQRAQMDHVRVLGGILPKSDATTGGGSGVWRDDPAATHWWVDESGRYLPAFSNRVYYSAMRDTGSLTGKAGAVVNLREFAFGLVVPCEHALKEGDRITLRVNSVAARSTSYQPGDEIRVDVVGAAPAWLSGGVTGDDTRTWLVSGTVSGVLPALLAPLGSVASHSVAGVSLELVEGGVPFELGDSFAFSVEAGQFHWRRDGGAWSTPEDLPAAGASVPLFEGVAATFVRGVAPAFVAGDLARHRVHQPASPAGVRRFRGDGSGWQWTSPAATLDADLGGLREVAVVAMAGHALPDGASLVVYLSVDGVAWEAYPMDVSLAVAVLFLPVRVTVRYLRVEVSGAAGGRLGWVYAGVPFLPARLADDVRLRRAWAMRRGAGVNPSAVCAGRGTGGEIAWSWIDQADADDLLALIDHCQRLDEPLIFVPSHMTPEDAALARLAADEVELGDWFQFHRGERDERVLSARLPLAGVIA